MEKELLHEFEKLKSLIKNGQDMNTWLDIQGIAKYLNVSVSHVRGLVKDNIIPHSRTRQNDQKSKLLFNRKLIDAWLLTGDTKPNKKQIDRIKQYII